VADKPSEHAASIKTGSRQRKNVVM
jgi:hypothetical protein